MARVSAPSAPWASIAPWAIRLETILAGRRYAGTSRTVREGIVERMLRDHVDGPAFAWFVERPRARIAGAPPRSRAAKEARMRWDAERARVQNTPVALVSPAAAEAMGAPRIARLNERVMHKQAIRHPGTAAYPAAMTLADYRILPDMLRTATPTRERTQDPRRKSRWLFEEMVTVEGEQRPDPLRVAAEVDEETGWLVIVSAHWRGEEIRPAGR